MIFEDLDRLKNPKIFEELRQLNFVLNNRSKPFGTIKFIYATRSDLFNADTTEDTGIEKINTKVFDLIIPVIPFLTKVNFGKVLQDEYEKIGLTHKIDGVENVLSRHTSDMRVVKAVLNNILLYKNTFELQYEADYRNAAALSILRVFAPNDYMKLSTGNSLLDLARERCSVKKEDSLKQAQEKRTPEYKIKQNSQTIWESIRSISGSLSRNANVQYAIINNEQFPMNDNLLIKIYKAKQGSSVQINWGNYNQRNYSIQQLQDIIASYVKDDPASIPVEKEMKDLAERDCFTFYDNSISFPDERVDEKSQAIVKELLENTFVTEGYTRFITQTTDANSSIDKALRYMYNYIRSNKRNDEYVLDFAAASEVMKRVDNTDLMSAGIYNFSLFDFLIRHIDIYSEQLNRILLNAKANLELFMNFFDNYCYGYKSELEKEDCTGLNNSIIKALSRTIPPAFLTMKLAKIYPTELIKKVTWSSLRDTNAKEVIYNIAIISLENPSSIILEKSDRSFLNYYTDTIVKNENGKENLFKLCIANDMPIDNLGIYNMPSEEIKHYLDKMTIVINKQNLDILEEDTILEYIMARQLTADDFSTIMMSNKEKIKQYIVRNIEKTMAEGDLRKCLQEAAAYIYEKKISLSAPELLQYAGRTSTKNLIGMLLIPDLTKEEVVAIMSKCNDGNLNKIQTKNSIIKLCINRNNEAFAKKLEAFNLVSRQNSYKDKKIIRLQVL